MMGLKYSFEARLEFARRLSAIFQSPASNSPMRFEVTLVHSWLLLLLFWHGSKCRQFCANVLSDSEKLGQQLLVDVGPAFILSQVPGTVCFVQNPPLLGR
jgi:hypothetical protein